VTVRGRALAVLAAGACVTAGPGAAAAVEAGRWTDADGRVHYGDKAPPGATAKEVAVPASPRTPPASQVRVGESVIRPYDIAGTTFAELNTAGMRSGPVSKNTGARVWGMCTWQVTWTFSRGGVGQCTLGKFSVMVGATIDLPRWINRDAASESVRGSWDRFAAGLRVHEDGHKDIGVRAANDLANQLRALPPARTCDELDRNITALGDRILAEHRALDQAYDRATGNGATQGAVLK
jgi:predicted secreted Zn-dependent protease